MAICNICELEKDPEAFIKAGGFTQKTTRACDECRANKNPGYTTEYNKERCKTDAQYARRMNASGHLEGFINRKDPSAYSEEIGCTVAELRAHVESLFQPGMTWDNRGRAGWHLGRVFPLSVARKAGPEVLTKALNWRNVQPLWAKDNYAKFFRLPDKWPTVEAFMFAW